MSGRPPLLRVLGCVGLLPAWLLAVLGWTLGLAALPFSGRRRIVARNQAGCFPERGGLWRAWLLVRHYALLGRFFVDNCAMISSSPRRMKKFVRVTGAEHLRAHAGKPVILAAPHFHGVLLGCVRLAQEGPLLAMHSPQHGRLANAIITASAANYGSTLQLFENRDGMIAKAVSGLRAGRPLYYPGDVDLRDYAKHAFVPFLGVANAATLTAVRRLARITGAQVLPCVTVMRPLGGYQMSISAPLQNFPSQSEYADLSRFNEFIGERVKRSPAQYYWPHRRFKTRPPGEADFYA